MDDDCQNSTPTNRRYAESGSPSSSRREAQPPNMARQMFRCWLSSPFSSVRKLVIPSSSSSAAFPSIPNRTIASTAAAARNTNIKTKGKEKKRAELVKKKDKEKRRTRSDREFDLSEIKQTDENSDVPHVPVMLGEVVDVFSSLSLRSFVDCTLGAAGHSVAIIQSHPELERYVGMDVDPIAHAEASSRIDAVLGSRPGLKGHTFLKNFRGVKSVLAEVDQQLLSPGVDAILMDLGMSSMQVNNPERGFSVLANGPLDMRMDPQASLKAEDILNSWPDTEVGRVLRDYGEESNWYLLQNKIVRARLRGGLHSTGQLTNLIRSATHGTRGGRQGWIKTATRVFQALRIAVNDELNTLDKSLHDCFECLALGGRLAVISFHSLEDRIVKQTFLNIIGSEGADGDGGEDERSTRDLRNLRNNVDAKETWIRQTVQGHNGRILTKRPITPSEEEERLNRRSRSAKLRVIEKVQ